MEYGKTCTQNVVWWIKHATNLHLKYSYFICIGMRAKKMSFFTKMEKNVEKKNDFHHQLCVQ